VAIVRAAVGYERADADAMGRALEATTADAKKLPVFAALNLAPDILLGRAGTVWLAADAPTKVLDISHDDAPWSDLVAMDAALDLGLIDVADAIQTNGRGRRRNRSRRSASVALLGTRTASTTPIATASWRWRTRR